MPSMLEHESNNLVKVMVASDSGSGKTGALASLVDAGFNLRILDFDNGLSVLKGFVKDKSKLANVHYVDKLQDDLKLVAGRLGVAIANYDDNQHAVNENLTLQALWGGIEVYAGLLSDLDW